MTSLVELPSAFPRETSGQQDRADWCCAQLEEGNILFFPSSPFELPGDDRQFLLTQHQSGVRVHKNIAYRPAHDRLTGYAGGNAAQVARLHGVMRRYSQQVIRFVAVLLSPYAAHWRVDFASFRPQQEKGRQIRFNARNDLLHLDSFPTRPANGNRILRIFTNINPSESRVWNTSETFAALAERYAGTPKMPLPESIAGGRRMMSKLVHSAGLGRIATSPYDRWMLRFHHFLKANENFQRHSVRTRWEFPPQSTWLVFTDAVSHAALSGQFALEQTLIISRNSLLRPELAPVNILERMAGCRITLD